MLFALIKLYARFAIQIYCRKIVINKPDYLYHKGPLLFAANHPNSFLDGIILTTLFKEPVYSLARGDAFKNKYFNNLLRWLRLLPVYRTSEGVENLGHNYTTFAACQQVFEKKGVVLIFSEGRCINEWHLRPLKKGTARLAISTWGKGIPLKVIPLGFNYSSFRTFGNAVHLNFGEVLDEEKIREQDSEGKQLLRFNSLTQQQLTHLVYEINKGDKKALKKTFTVTTNFLKVVVLALPALVGFVSHFPLYLLVKKITNVYFDNDHYDSVVQSLLMLLYPLYSVLWALIIGFNFGIYWAITSLVLLPFCAWALVQVKYDFKYLFERG
ncbi:MAG TPA: 1-acyl-sn-glycerol-3-phosphate acyltransferase [Chitinophagaceae bacterium]|nr:1-acyl-sn-glycerol-3-phosphate acyltransferase [Chitinophagaceae bacterium]